MSKIRVWSILLAAVVLICAVLWAAVRLMGLQASLIWTALVGILAWAVQSAVQQRQKYRRLLTKQKREQYFEFLNFLNEFFSPAIGRRDRDRTDPRMLQQLRRWSLRLTMIGSDEVVQAWNAARISGAIEGQAVGGEPAGEQNVSLLRAWGRLWLAMRRDCGHVDTRLKTSDMLASIVNDIEA
jgi:hypothetical protein